MQTYPAHVIDAIQTAWAWLATQGDYAQPGVVLALCFGIPWLLRSVVAEQWEAVTDWTVRKLSVAVGPDLALRLRKAVQAVPSLGIAAALGVLVEGGDVGAILKIELYALFAPLLHEALKAYTGGRPPAARTVVRVRDGGSILRSLSGLLLLLALPLLGGCSGSLVGAQRDALSARYGSEGVDFGYAPSARCQELSDRHATWSAIAKGGAVLAGTSGVATLPADELPERVQGPARYTAAGISVTSAAIAAAAAVVAEDAAESFTRECLP